MAVGDSITAGFAARSTLFEARDISWSIGAGSAAQLTLPYLLGRYGDAAKFLQGMSTKAVLPKDVLHLPKGDWHPATDHLNVAESQASAVHFDSLVEQWGFLHGALGDARQYPNLDSRWKVLTVWMTANDVCGAGHECKKPVKASTLDTWTQRTDALLHNVSATMKRVYVNLVSTLDLSNVHRIQQSRAWCKFEHQHILRECGCIDRGDPKELKQLDANIKTMNDALHGLAAKWHAALAAQGRTDMAVTVQAYQEGVGASLDHTFLNALDCFHPSQRGHEDLAIGLWNDMLCTGDRKNRCGRPFANDLAPVCPTADSVFYTGPDVIPNPLPTGA